MDTYYMDTYKLQLSDRFICSVGSHLAVMLLSVTEVASSQSVVSSLTLLSYIVQGHTLDTNSAFLTRALRKLGVSVQRITVIPDIQEIIAKEVALLSAQYTHLITSGGIGPTHDDVTFESVAMAFQEELYPHPELTRLVQEFFGVVDRNSTTFKLAMVPRSAKLNYGTDPQTGKPLRYPLVGKHSVGFSVCSPLMILGPTKNRNEFKIFLATLCSVLLFDLATFHQMTGCHIS